jgi:hypothetical protein
MHWDRVLPSHPIVGLLRQAPRLSFCGDLQQMKTGVQPKPLHLRIIHRVP